MTSQLVISRVFVYAAALFTMIFSSFLKPPLFKNLNAARHFKLFCASSKYCLLLLIFANSFDHDQARQNVGPDLDPNCLTPDSVPERIFWKKLIFEKSQQATKFHEKLPSMQ